MQLNKKYFQSYSHQDRILAQAWSGGDILRRPVQHNILYTITNHNQQITEIDPQIGDFEADYHVFLNVCLLIIISTCHSYPVTDIIHRCSTANKLVTTKPPIVTWGGGDRTEVD